MNKKKIMYLTLTILTLIIVISGSTYAYFALSTSNNNSITGTTADVGLTLTVTKLKPNTNTTDYLVPQLESALGTAINNTNNCKDANTNTVCQVYKATLTNTGTANAKLKGTISFSNVNNLPNLKWKLITDATTLGSNPTNNATSSTSTFVAESNLNPNQSIDYYFVVWINETGSEQSDNGSYTASITFTSSNGKGITSTIGDTFTGTIYRNSTESLMIGNTIAQETKNGYCDIETSSGTQYDCFETESECQTFLQVNGYTGTDTCQPRTYTTGISNYTTNPSSLNKIYYLKHTIENDIVTESYIEFIVTPAMAQANPGMTAGTYTLRGAGATYDSANNQYNNDSPYFETNKQTLLTAFGSSNCSVSSSIVHCNVSGLDAYAYAHGDVNANDGSAYCSVDRGGYSNCSSW